MGTDKRTIVHINGEAYSILGNESSEHVQNVAANVDEVIQLLSSQLPPMNATGIAVLAAVNFANEVYKLQSDVADYKEKTDASNAQLAEEQEKKLVLKQIANEFRTESHNKGKQLEEYETLVRHLNDEMLRKKQIITNLEQRIASDTHAQFTKKNLLSELESEISCLISKVKEKQASLENLEIENLHKALFQQKEMIEELKRENENLSKALPITKEKIAELSVENICLKNEMPFFNRND